jgi:hypothetical protein
VGSGYSNLKETLDVRMLLPVLIGHYRLQYRFLDASAINSVFLRTIYEAKLWGYVGFLFFFLFLNDIQIY